MKYDHYSNSKRAYYGASLSQNSKCAHCHIRPATGVLVTCDGGYRVDEKLCRCCVASYYPDEALAAFEAASADADDAGHAGDAGDAGDMDGVLDEINSSVESVV